MAEPKMRWDESRRNRTNSDKTYGGAANTDDRLHKNCDGCQCINIQTKKCLYVRFPRQRKWPCFFKDKL